MTATSCCWIALTISARSSWMNATASTKTTGDPSSPSQIQPRTQMNWVLRSCDAAQAESLAHAVGVPLPVAQLLVHRGISDAARARHFLRPELGDLHSPYA